MDAFPYILLKNEVSRFCNLNSETWVKFKEIFSPVEVLKNDFFAKEGEKSSTFGFIYSGCFRTFNLLESGKELTKHFLCSKNFVAGALYHNNKNIVSIQALTKCKVLVADYKKLDEIAENNPIMSGFRNNLVSRYVALNLCRENRYLTAYSSKRYDLFLKEFPNLINEIPHYYIAGYLGISTTQLSRIRKKTVKKADLVCYK